MEQWEDQKERKNKGRNGTMEQWKDQKERKKKNNGRIKRN